MKKTITFLFLTFFTISFSQDLVLIKFNDKPLADTYFSEPTLMLSQKALDRRAKYNIELNIQDVPVETSYINQVVATGVEVIAISKWFNGIFAWATESQVTEVESLSCVSEVESFVQNDNPKTNNVLVDKFVLENQFQNVSYATTDFEYGATEIQVTQLNLDYLHNLGFTGEGITIAVMDGGFPGVDVVEGFRYLRENEQIKGGYNFVDDNDNIYTRSSHGTSVLSTMGGYLENQFVGTAINADYYLYITENTDRELPDEEVHWIAAAEVADSIGVDIINTSLGYNTFNDSRYNYDYSDMNGQVSYISRGAKIAAEKGILVVNSAGNSGNDSWYYITAPADGIGVFTIGAVDSDGNPAHFSSYGPTSDDRIKPDVDALGYGSSVIRPDGSIRSSNGTSFSSPIMAGSMACLLQAFPSTQLGDLKQKVRESANLYDNPTDQMGYGIPDFGEAYEALLLSVSDFTDENHVKVYPNPTSNSVNIQSDKEIKQIELISVEGKRIKKDFYSSQINLNKLPKGIYLLKIQFTDDTFEVKKVVKK